MIRFKHCSFLIMMGLVLFLASCGSNLFVATNEDKTSSVGSDADKVTTDSGASSVISNISDLLNSASTKDQYKNLQSAADSIINNPNISSSVKEDAKKVKGEAGLGALGITPLDLAANVMGSVTGNITPADLVSKFGLSSDVTTKSIKVVANAYNDVSNAKMTSSNFTSKAVANTVVVLKSVETVYDVDNDRFITAPKQSLDALVKNDESGHNVVYYANTAVDSYQRSGSLNSSDTADLKKGIDDFQTSTNEMVTLDQQANSNGKFTHEGTVYNFATGTITTSSGSVTKVEGTDAEKKDKLISAAFSDILSGVGN